MRVRREDSGRIVIQAPAKLNLFLEILARRHDGYHDLESLMVTVDLCDTLHFDLDPTGRLTLECDDPTLPTDSSNLVVRAAERLQEESGTKQGARIALRKVIPAQAGLAGGSSDAAATLEGLRRLWGLDWPDDRIDALAATLGSDVPFFRHGPWAICRGRGERVEPLAGPAMPLHFVLVCPPLGVATARVYAQVVPPSDHRSVEGITTALASGNLDAVGRALFNRLQPVAEALEPTLASIPAALTRLEPPLLGHLMSGSGSSYFGLARSRSAAEDAATQLRLLGPGRVQVVTCGP